MFLLSAHANSVFAFALQGNVSSSIGVVEGATVDVYDSGTSNFIGTPLHPPGDLA